MDAKPHSSDPGRMSAIPAEQTSCEAEGETSEEVRAAVELFEQNPLLRVFLDAVPDIVLVLDEQRRIVFANRRLLQILGCRDPRGVCGLRPGEVLDCIHAHEAPAGCGTTEFCRTCGALKAIVSSLLGRELVEECRILRSNSEAIEFRVWTTPLTLASRRFTIFSLADITHEKRRAVLERVFFHDLLNLAGALHGYAQYLGEASPEEIQEIRRTIIHLTQRLIEEIRSQQVLHAAEQGELEIHPSEIDARSLLEQLSESYRLHPVARDREIVVDPSSEKVFVVTDRTLLTRVLENMLKNALEAIGPGQRVTMRCMRLGEQVRFEVHNPGVMPPDVRLQIFVRSFTTKGHGRGLGTYSMKLFAEKYLGGAVSFETSAQAGTTFRVDLPLVIEAKAELPTTH